MIGKLNHIAIAVPDLISASGIYKNILGASVSDPVPMPDHGVTTVFVELPNTKIELLEPLGDDSPIQNYLLKNPKGGMHHICFEVEKITETINSLKNKKINILGDGNPKIGAHDKPVVFLHPNDLSGTLVELEET